MVCGVNTVFEDWELWLCALGTGTYLFLIVTFLATEQTAVACWCLPVLPVLFFDAWRSYMRAKNRRIVLPSAVAAIIDAVHDNDGFDDSKAVVVAAAAERTDG